MSENKELGLRHIIMELEFNATEDTLFERMSLKRLIDLEKDLSERLVTWKKSEAEICKGYCLALETALGNVSHFKCFGKMTKNKLMTCKNSCEAYNWCRRVTNRSITKDENILLDSDKSACSCAFCNR